MRIKIDNLYIGDICRVKKINRNYNGYIVESEVIRTTIFEHLKPDSLEFSDWYDVRDIMQGGRYKLINEKLGIPNRYADNLRNGYFREIFKNYKDDTISKTKLKKMLNDREDFYIALGGYEDAN